MNKKIIKKKCIFLLPVIILLSISSCSLLQEQNDCKIRNESNSNITIMSLSGYVEYSGEKVIIEPLKSKVFISESSHVGESLYINLIVNDEAFTLNTGYIQDKSYIKITINSDLTLSY